MKQVSPSELYTKAPTQLEIVEHFWNGLPSGFTGAGSVETSGRGGILALTTSTTDNNASSLTPDTKFAVLAAGKPIHFGCRLQFAEANTNTANVFVGLFSGSVAAAMGSDGAGPPADYSGFCFFKADGSTLWSVEGSVSTSQTTLELTAQASLDSLAKTAGSASYQHLEIEVLPKTTTKADVIFTIDGIVVAKFTDFTYTSIASMAPVVLVRTGGTVAESVLIDLYQFVQTL